MHFATQQLNAVLLGLMIAGKKQSIPTLQGKHPQMTTYRHSGCFKSWAKK